MKYGRWLMPERETAEVIERGHRHRGTLFLLGWANKKYESGGRGGEGNTLKSRGIPPICLGSRLGPSLAQLVLVVRRYFSD